MRKSMTAVIQKRIDLLTVNVYANRQEMGEDAARDVAGKMKQMIAEKGRVRMVFAAAPSQNEFLAALSGEDGIDWQSVTVFHMDEYIGLPQGAPQSFARFLRQKLFDLVSPGRVHLIDTSAPPEKECERYSRLLKEDDIDIVCFGIGENGHLAFNDPPVADFEDPQVMKVVTLDQVCRQQQVNDGCFDRLEDVPYKALTLTIPTLLDGKNLYCIVPGKRKQEAVQKTLYGEISTSCPASILRRHPNCTLYLDFDSFGGSRNGFQS
ncbi:glucosamine-6-phosphate deaminase [Caldalkalibacillus uzonensis]|uniref:Glucosamine-6-phosphate deaminase n=1 Tax=Caldalkalibacillus uzonensis TaxID=353224 RepID=A0ABU0CQB0_9BACI|nr:glucosamine-6-phosphate deaminase [Caldalkalibacillus uzonensis]MDQ0338564.1 glucosamine-6-phosphate deaminase [Caldalkalibacillus uzonensis]